jgi:2'-5' RNA ligase
MSEQLSFAAFDTGPVRDRVFFAIFPDADAARRIAGLAQHLGRKNGLTAEPLAPERFHVTLHHLGDYAGLPQGIVAAARKAAAGIVLPPFEIIFDRAVSFFGSRRNHPFVLRCSVPALMAFQHALGVAMAKAGYADGRWAGAPFTPHVTLLYDEHRAAEQAIETISWTAREFVLVHSLLGETRHIPLGRWPLGA